MRTRWAGVVAGFASLAALVAWMLTSPPADATGADTPAPMPIARVETQGSRSPDVSERPPTGAIERAGDAVLIGRVVAAGGRAVGGASVEITTSAVNGPGAYAARTDPEGAFRIEVPAPVTLGLAKFGPTASTPGFTVTLAFEIDAGESILREFFVPVAARVTATVVTVDGAPLEGLDVEVFDGLMQSAGGGERQPTRRLVSSEGGAATFSAPGEECHAWAVGRTHVPVVANEQLGLMRREAAAMRLVVADAFVWAAKVVSPEGQPVGDAEITVQPAWSLDVGPLAMPPGSGARLPPARTVRTDAGGAFSLRLADGFPYGLRVRSAGFATLARPVRSGEAPPTLELAAGVTLVGTVTGVGGGPIPGARVEVRGTNLRTALTDPAGRYDLPAMSRQGVDTLSVRAEGFVPYTVRIDHERADASRLDVALTPSRTAVGRVEDHLGRPAAGVYVIVAQEGDAPPPIPEPPTGESRSIPIRTGPPDTPAGDAIQKVRNQHATITGVDGRFKVKSLSPGDHEVVLAFGPDRRVRVTERITTGSETVIRLPDPERVGAVLFGRVTDASARTAVPVFSILPQRVKGSLKSGSVQRFDDDDGAYRLVGLQTGSFELLVDAPGYASRTIELHLGPGVRRQDIALYPGRRATFGLENRTRAPDGVLLRFFDAGGSPVLVESRSGMGVDAVRLQHGEPLTVGGLPACPVKIVVRLWPNGAERVQYADLRSVDGLIEILVPR